MKRTNHLFSAILKPSHLKKTTTHLVPELKLHLLTSQDKIWHEEWKNQQAAEPFWAIFWPGGQVLSRFIFDSKITAGKRGMYVFKAAQRSAALLGLVLLCCCVVLSVISSKKQGKEYQITA